MDMTKMMIAANILFGAILFGLSLPLLLRKVPMNDFYGIRIPAAFESKQRWYDINAYGGRQLAAWSWLPIAAGVAGFFIPVGAAYVYAPASLAFTAVATMVPILLIYRWSRRH
jgi:SdpI/YfhL protein family